MLVIVSSADLFFVYPTTVQGYGLSCLHFWYAPVCLSILHSDHCTVVAQASWERANVHEEVKSSFSAVATKDNCRYHINIQTHFLLENYSTFTNFSMEIRLGWVIFWVFLQKDWLQYWIWYLKLSLPVVLPLSLFPFLKWHVQVVTNYLLLLGFQAC